MQTTLSDNMVPEAKAIAKDLIENHVVPTLDSEILEQGKAILDDYDKLDYVVNGIDFTLG